MFFFVINLVKKLGGIFVGFERYDNILFEEVVNFFCLFEVFWVI